jgi:hypothetical protein
MLSWSLCVAAPAALDLARWLAGCASVIDATREQVIADFRLAQTRLTLDAGLP